LSRHLIRIGLWSEDAHRELSAALEREARDTFRHVESFGTAAKGLAHSTESLFEDVYTTVPPQLTEQIRELQVDSCPAAAVSKPPFGNPYQRAVG
jgi:2-oxoisovalerate dehydrogenase E1 component alpha subunit